MVWEMLFMLVVLKLPIVYLVAVVLWAIRAQPKPPEGARLLAPLDPLPRPDGHRTPRRPRNGPHGHPVRSVGPRRAARAATARSR